MKGVIIRIATDNAAFEDDDYGREVARILRELADRIYNCVEPAVGTVEYALRDANGNWVGRADLGAELGNQWVRASRPPGIRLKAY